ncbi:MAG: tRNA uridine(34) 5-carboxymethylaminomethyl modification radical SAM/GNAT enzyme Elp3 [Patescibacteria group bacterium]|jgi:ELP3 family radical SAM enzyme/protein acetyltransferase
MEKNNKIFEEIVLELMGQKYPTDLDFSKQLRQAFSSRKLPANTKATLILAYRQLLKKHKIKANSQFEQLLKKRAVRTLSGVSVITVLTKPFACPGTCVYCPTEIGMPKSYLSNEPAAARAKMNLFNPFRQVTMRIQALENNGHAVDKLEVLVLGGTWSVYPTKYQNEFIRDCFYAANIFPKKTKRKPLALEKEQKINETAKYKIIGLTLETRPDFINPAEIKKMRALGTTRVQLGIQHTDNKILKKIKRRHTLEQSIEATRQLKEVGIKVDHHYMPDLPGSTPQKDLAMFKYVFTSPDLQPDQIKIYPCVVNEHAELYKLFKQKKYKPYTKKQLLNLLINVKKIVPPYLRINRLIRDIPEESIVAGNKITNLRQYLQKELARCGASCQCLRCREVRDEKYELQDLELVRRDYLASQGKEIFLSFENKDQSKVYAFLRLRLNHDPKKNIFPELKNASIIRELHVYGQMVPVYHEALDDELGQTQHLGLGKRLMKEAEKITQDNNLKK